jgi:acetyltransferase-like isoleucine patch superfamily enzyme
MLAAAAAFLLGTANRIRTRLFTWLMSPLLYSLGGKSRICPPFRFANLQQVRVGRAVVINRDCWIGVVSDSTDRNSVKLTIGNGCAIGMGATISATSSIVLEDDVLLARNVYISDHGHAFSDISRPIKDQGITAPAPVRIGKGTWLGQNVVVLPGVTIGEHCVVGANAVVRESIPPNSVSVGIPARVVRRYNSVTRQWEKAPPTSASHALCKAGHE